MHFLFYFYTNNLKNTGQGYKMELGDSNEISNGANGDERSPGR